MKSKKTTYILLPLVVLIWGYVVYSIITYGEPEESIEPIRVGDIVASKREVKENRTLQLNYADPFLKSVSASSLQRTSGIQSRQVKPVKKLPEVNWGNIVYNGFVRNNQRKTKIALLNIDGQQQLGARGDSFAGKTVLSIHQDSVKLQFGKATKWFKKSNE
ncbi:MAG: hypothetical protein AAFO69_12910 [Bacteroidota bacterium]